MEGWQFGDQSKALGGAEAHHASARRALRILDAVGRAGSGLSAKRLAGDLGVSLRTNGAMCRGLLQTRYGKVAG